ncbi:MAG: biotin/lipoyl-binding protein [Verrucomicrobiales bacterium]|nr:biotin/lipoyl-binding protein [Verrucomicrobiales bacterium]
MAHSDEENHVTVYQRPWWMGVRQYWPLLVFVFFIVLAAFLYANGGKYRVMTGTAERIVENIAPLESARIESIHVKVGDRVKAGDIIAQLDTGIIDAENAVQKERIVRASLEAKLEQLTLERQFSSALQEAEQALREAKMDLRLNAVEHDALVKEIARLEPLQEKRLVSAESLAAKQARESVLRETLKLMPDHIEALAADVERAKEQQATALARMDEMKANTASATDAQGEAIKLLNIRRDGYTLRAKQEGVVAEIDGQPGDVVEPGGTIASLLIQGPIRVVGFLPESDLSAVAIGTPANIYPTVSLRETGVISGRVAQVSPAVYSLPERASPIRGQVVRGRRVVLDLDEVVNLIPGETVSIEIESSLFTPISLTD